MYSIYVLLEPRVPNFSRFHSTASCLPVIISGYFEKSTPNDLEMTLNPTRSNVPYIFNVQLFHAADKLIGVGWGGLFSIKLKWEKRFCDVLCTSICDNPM